MCFTTHNIIMWKLLCTDVSLFSRQPLLFFEKNQKAIEQAFLIAIETCSFILEAEEADEQEERKKVRKEEKGRERERKREKEVENEMESLL